MNWSCWTAATLAISKPGWESFPGFALAFTPTHPHDLWLLTAGSSPSTRPTSLRRYFLRKTYHLRRDWSTDCAEAAATPAHNPPQASTLHSLHFLSLVFFGGGLFFFLLLIFRHCVSSVLPLECFLNTLDYYTVITAKHRNHI